VTHLLVTNDFPPKVGGIQAYLWELWRRFDPETFVVLTAQSHPDAVAFDREQAARGIRIERVAGRILVPTPQLAHRIRETARRVGAGLAVIDPAFPLGVVGPRLGLPYAVLLHGAEVAIPGRLLAGRELLAHVLRRSSLVVSAGGYPAAEAARALRGRGMPSVVEIPPGVDLDRFRPLSPSERSEARRDLGLPTEGPLVVSVSRLVPRKGMDVLVDAAVLLRADLPDLTVAIAGRGRDSDRLALVSDCFYTLDPQSGIKGSARVPHPAFNLDTEQARDSIRKLAAMEPAVVWSGHADPVTGDVRAELERAAAAH